LISSRRASGSRGTVYASRWRNRDSFDHMSDDELERAIIERLGVR
jgi:hypothetical protein